jgi:dienelactone hydrolase
MPRLLTTLLAFFILTNTYGQRLEKVFLEKGDTSRNCYTLVYPPARPWKGYLVLVPGFGETAHNVLQQTSLPLEAARKGLLTIIPTLHQGTQSFGVDSASQQALRRIVSDVARKHDVRNLRCYVGGFSIGGSTAIKFAELASNKPAAVFAIDPPLDFEQFYHAAQRDIRLAAGGQPSAENVYMVDRIKQEMGGPPETVRPQYYRVSPYSFADTSQTAIKRLLQVPLRLYSEPDIQWWLSQRRADLTSMNVTMCSAMINELNRLGNRQATLVVTQDKGYRKPTNQRHPHAWSIADSGELVAWLLQQR